VREASERTTQITEQLATLSTREIETRAELAEMVRALRIEELTPVVALASGS
jgi:hypothetical protein